MAIKDITGIRFGRLIALHPTVARCSSFVKWLCICDCGKEKIIAGSNLRRGLTRSCGCLRIEITIKRFTTHNESGTNLYTTWGKMIARCANPSDAKWPRYGGRGIKVCDRWLKFENFLSDMGARPEGMTLERENNNGNYELGNVIWANQKTQQKNRSTNRLLTLGGITLNTTQWAARLGLSLSTIQRRLAKGWPTEKVLSHIRFKRTSLLLKVAI